MYGHSRTSSTKTPQRERYFLSIVDGYSNAVWVHPLRTRDDATGEFRKFKENVVNRHTIKYIRRIRSDRAPELFQGQMAELFAEYKIEIRDTTAPDASTSQNGKAERSIRTVTTMARTMMLHAGCPDNEWGEAIKFAAHLIR